jgi:hypothetical protein
MAKVNKSSDFNLLILPDFLGRRQKIHLSFASSAAKVLDGESGRFACLESQIRKKAAQSLLSRVTLTIHIAANCTNRLIYKPRSFIIRIFVSCLILF